MTIINPPHNRSGPGQFPLPYLQVVAHLQPAKVWADQERGTVPAVVGSLPPFLQPIVIINGEPTTPRLRYGSCGHVCREGTLGRQWGRHLIATNRSAFVSVQSHVSPQGRHSKPIIQVSKLSLTETHGRVPSPPHHSVGWNPGRINNSLSFSPHMLCCPQSCRLLESTSCGRRTPRHTAQTPSRPTSWWYDADRCFTCA